MSTIKPEPVITIDGYKCRIILDRYLNGQIAMMLTTEEGEPFGRPSYPDEKTVLALDEMLMKDYTEYEGWPKLFIDAGLAEETGRFSRTYGFPILKLLIEVPPIMEIL